MNLQRAIHTAVLAHQHQKDKQGELYILHPLRVMLALTGNEEDMILGAPLYALQFQECFSVSGFQLWIVIWRTSQVIFEICNLDSGSSGKCRYPLNVLLIGEVSIKTQQMTEKEFKEQCLAAYSDPSNPEMIAEIALELAKKRGAVFDLDLEPVKLPDLKVSGFRSKSYAHSVCTTPTRGFPYGRALTFAEAQEVVRRCRVVKKMNDFMATLIPGAGLNSHEIKTLCSILKED